MKRKKKGEAESYEVIVNSIAGYEIREESYKGRKHVVVPVVMMVEGVHSGSVGPIMHTASELSKFVDAWNGRPVVLEHPRENGRFISAGRKDVHENQHIGIIFNSRFDGKLRAEAWIDVEDAADKAPDVLEAVMNGQPLETSVGVFSQEDGVPGVWNGERYNATAVNHRPDHLAILMSGLEGACSLADGCGIRANSYEGGNESEVTANEEGFESLMRQIRGKLNGMDTSVKNHYLVEVFKDKFIFEIEPTLSAPTTQGEGTNLFQMAYEVNDGLVEFQGQPAPVKRQVSFIALQSGGKKNTRGGENVKRGDKKDCPKCPELVNALIANERTHWGEEDRQLLSEIGEDLGEEALAKFMPIANEEEDETLTPAPEAKPTTPKNNEEAMAALQGSISKIDDVLALLSPEMRDQMSSALSMHKARRAELTTQIVANSKFVEAELKSKSMDELTKLAELISVPADYSAHNAGTRRIGGVESVEVEIPIEYQKQEATA